MNVRLFLKRDTSGVYSRFEVADDRGMPKYRVCGKRTASGESVRICGMDDKPVCRIRRLGFSALAAYTITAGGETVRLNIAVSGGAASVRFRGISFFIRGDVIGGNYDVLDADNSVVCAVYKDFAKRCLTLTIELEERELFCIAAAVCIDSLSTDAVPALQMT